MKKVLITVLAVFYLGVSSGTTVYFHYCMEQLVNVGLGHAKSSKCSNCGMERTASKECCKDKHQQLKIEQAQNTAQSNLLLKQLPISALSQQLALFIVQAVPSSIEEHPISHSPPHTEKLPLFIQNRTFRI